MEVAKEEMRIQEEAELEASWKNESQREIGRTC